MKYLICFRGSDHPHDALKDGLQARGGNLDDPIKYEGGIDTDSAIPMSPLLDVAAAFPYESHPEELSVTTIDVILIPIPDEMDSILMRAIKEGEQGGVKSVESESNGSFVNTSSIQKMNSINLLRMNDEDMMEEVYDGLSGMIWSHEVAVKQVPRENVVATLKCQRQHAGFTISDIIFQQDNVVNPDFLRLKWDEKLKDYLSKFTEKKTPFHSWESRAYRGYKINDEDYSNIHNDGVYQIYLEEAVQFCDKHKLMFTHEDNVFLMRHYKDTSFSLEILLKVIEFCETASKQDPDKFYDICSALLESQQNALLYLLARDHGDINNPHNVSVAHKAVENNNAELIKFLILNDESYKSRDDKGRTPLHMAAINGDVEIVRLLLNAKQIDTKLADHDGKTAEDYAKQSENDELKKCFQFKKTWTYTRSSMQRTNLFQDHQKDKESGSSDQQTIILGENKKGRME